MVMTTPLWIAVGVLALLVWCLVCVIVPHQFAKFEEPKPDPNLFVKPIPRTERVVVGPFGKTKKVIIGWDYVIRKSEPPSFFPFPTGVNKK